MSDHRIAVRVSEAIARRLDALIPLAARLPEFAANVGTVDRSKIVRAALLRGLDALEGETKAARGKGGRHGA